jgi:UPF0755 protein
LLALLIVGSAAAFALWLRASLNEPVEHGAGSQIIKVEPGTGPSAIIDQLKEAGIVRGELALKVYLRLSSNGGRLKAGDYRFESPITALQVVDKLVRGEVNRERVTIPEGYSRFEIAETLAEKTGKATVEEFLRLVEDPSLIQSVSAEATSLEGYLFPDTYHYTSSTTAEEMVREMVDRFQEVFTPQWSIRASELGMSVHAVTTLASIVEEEARVADERPRIASVFYNRLRIGMPLASDPTFIYAAILAGDYDGNPNQPRHRRRLSRYNTYIYAGLPPGPIASPGRASLEAVLYAESTDYLYFVVSGSAGRHKFSRTSAEHEAAVQEYRRQQHQTGGR